MGLANEISSVKKMDNALNRPKITDEKIAVIRKLIEENPKMGRSKLSVLLCEMWNWRHPNGKVKGMSCRKMKQALSAY